MSGLNGTTKQQGEEIELPDFPLYGCSQDVPRDMESKMKASGISDTIKTAIALAYTDKILKFFVCIFYGIIPSWLKNHQKKACSIIATVAVCILHWFAVGGYIYCNRKFWSTTKTKTANNGTRSEQSIDSLPLIPQETLLLLVGLSTSGAITVTMAVHFFYLQGNNFSKKTKTQRRSFSLMPAIIHAEGDQLLPASISTQDWRNTNIIFAVGITSIIFILGTNLGTNTMFNFYGIRAFLTHTTITNKLIYYITLTMLFWGFIATVCACCIFHVMARYIIANIEQTQRLVLSQATTRAEFFMYHERLLTYRDKMAGKFKYWFAIHNSMFILLVAMMIYEWISFMKSSKYQHNYILSQTSGTVLICYKFAFPFISASLVTVKFKEFYVTIARSNRFPDIPELLLLSNTFGFEVFGLRITPSVAVIVILSSCVGFLKNIVAVI